MASGEAGLETRGRRIAGRGVMAAIALLAPAGTAHGDGGVAVTLSGAPTSPVSVRTLRVSSEATVAVRFRAPATATLATVLLPWRRPGTDCALELDADAGGALGPAIASAPIATPTGRWSSTPLPAALVEGQVYHLVARCRSQSGLLLYVNDAAAAAAADVWDIESVSDRALASRPPPAMPLFALVFADGTWWGQPYARREPLVVCDTRMVQATIVPAKTMAVADLVLGMGGPGEGNPIAFTLTAPDGTPLLASAGVRPASASAAAPPTSAMLVAGETYGLRLEAPPGGTCLMVPGLTSDLRLGRSLAGFDALQLSVTIDGGATWTPRPSNALAALFMPSDPPSTTTTQPASTTTTTTQPPTTSTTTTVTTTTVTTTTRPPATTTTTTTGPPSTVATTSTTTPTTTTSPGVRSTASVVASKDSFMTSPANPLSNYGNWTQAWIGWDGANVERTLVGFDLSSLPSGTAVAACSLAVTIQDIHGTPGPGHLYALTKDWTERGVTWTTTGVGSWTQPGAFADVGGSVAYPAPAGPGAFTFPDATALCQDAIANRGGRLAFLLRQDDESRSDEVSIATRESTTGARPTLTITIAGTFPSTTTTTTATTVTTTTGPPQSGSFKSIYASGYLGSYDKATIPIWPQRLGLILGGQSVEGAMLPAARQVAAAAGNTDVKFIYYFSMTDMDSRCQCFDQFFYDSFRGAHPEWILHDSSGNQVSTVNGIGRVYAIDIGNPALVDAWAQWALNGADQYGWDGVFADNVARGVFSEWSAWPINPRTQQAYTVPDWRRDILAALQRIQAQFHARGKIFVGNHSQAWQPDTFSDPIVQNEILTMDGVEIEDCIYNYDGTPHTETEWVAQLRYLDFANKHGVRTLCSGSTSGAIGDPSRRMFMLASYLLTKEGFSDISELNTLSDWWPDLAMDLGQPAGNYVCLDPGAGFAQTSNCPSTGKVYRRDWQKGAAIANPSPSSTFTVPLGGTFLDHGTPITSVTLGPQSGVVLTKP